jgi:hypothetical protein
LYFNRCFLFNHLIILFMFNKNNNTMIFIIFELYDLSSEKWYYLFKYIKSLFYFIFLEETLLFFHSFSNINKIFEEHYEILNRKQYKRSILKFSHIFMMFYEERGKYDQYRTALKLYLKSILHFLNYKFFLKYNNYYFFILLLLFIKYYNFYLFLNIY